MAVLTAPRALLLCAVVGISSVSPPSLATPIEERRARQLAKGSRCDEAIPLLEKLESQQHRPSSADLLASCYEKKGRLTEAMALYLKIAKVTGRQRGWSYHDVLAWRRASDNVVRLDKVIPTVTFEPAETYEELTIEIDGKPVPPHHPARVDPGERTWTVRAKNRRSQQGTVQLSRKDAEVITLQLAPRREVAPAPTPAPEIPERDEQEDEPDTPQGDPAWWLGARFEGILLPQFLMNAVGDGGTTAFFPGAAVTAMIPTAGPDLTFSIAYMSYGLGATAYKPVGTPDTDYEIIESSLMTLTVAMDVMWSIPLDSAEIVSVRLGGSLGVGWAFVGELNRTQSYPVGFAPGDPDRYVPCDGPNEPAGSFRYCNQLDKDADHYDGFAEPSWFEGGARPLIFPWIALPKVGLAFRPDRQWAIDLELGLNPLGLLSTIGFRYGLN